MEYNKVIAVTGLPGLYELLSSKSDGAIVRSLDDKTTRFVSSRVHNFSHLESIEIYTVRENVNLVDVLKAMEASDEKLPNDKDNNAVQAYFTKVFPDLDFTRVYASDMKKMVKWFSVLKSNDIEIKLTEPEEEVAVEEPAEEEKAAAKPKKEKAAPAATAEKAPAKKEEAAPKSKDGPSDNKPPARSGKAAKEEEEKAPAKKTAAKKEEAAPKKKAAKEEEEKPKKAAPKKAAKKK